MTHPKTDNSRPAIQLTAKDVERFLSKVDRAPGQGPNGDCWEWQGWRFKRPNGGKGYGGYGINYRDITAHRVAFFLHHHRWPEPFACHTCDNPPCCNPTHIWEGTHADNMADRKRKGHYATGDEHHTHRHVAG